MPRLSLSLDHQADGWYVVGLPGGPDCGPYDTRGEANEDRRGLIAFYQQNKHLIQPAPVQPAPVQPAPQPDLVGQPRQLACALQG
jgi:hypothetical protein